jgi:hypothetical protein
MLLDGGVHSIRRKIEVSRPRNRPQTDADPPKEVLVAQRAEDARLIRLKKRRHINKAGCPIVEPHAQPKAGYSFNLGNTPRRAGSQRRD